jgi:cytochrome P450
VQEEVAAEAGQVDLSPAQAPAALDRLVLTRAVVQEALRLYPPAFTIVRRALGPDRLMDENVEPGSMVVIAPWILHRHRKRWDHPERFDPTRFLPGAAPVDRFAYLPFGVGPRVCIGATFALQEAVIAMGVLMSKYRFDCVAETRPWPVQKLTTQPEGGLPMRVSRR